MGGKRLDLTGFRRGDLEFLRQVGVIRMGRLSGSADAIGVVACASSHRLLTPAKLVRIRTVDAGSTRAKTTT